MYVQEVIEKRDEEKEDTYDISDKRSLKKGIRDIYQNIWGNYSGVPILHKQVRHPGIPHLDMVQTGFFSHGTGQVGFS